MTLFPEILRGVGFSQADAARYLDVSLNTIKSWGAGRNPVPPGVFKELSNLAECEENAAINFINHLEEMAKQPEGWPETIEFGLASDDAEAQILGWPCVGAHRAVARRVWEMLPTNTLLTLVPRGSTVATAAAADQHERHGYLLENIKRSGRPGS